MTTEENKAEPISHIPLKEDLTNEFKSDLKCLSDEDLIEALVAFANTNGGHLYLGVEDDGRLSGLHKKHQDIMQLEAFIANQTVPPLSARAELVHFKPMVLRISVPRSNEIVATSRGKVLKRRLKADGSPENIPLYPFEFSSRLSSLGRLDYSSHPVLEARIEDFDPLAVSELQLAIQRDASDRSLRGLELEEIYAALCLTRKVGGRTVPTMSGLILLGKEEVLTRCVPAAETAVQVFVGSQLKVNESWRAALLLSLRKVEALIEPWNPEDNLDDGLFRVTIKEINPAAFREGLMNAYCHRDYTLLGRVRIEAHDAWLTISNPGGFVEGITLKNLLDAEPQGRNPTLATALKRLGLTERTGRGIDRIFEGSLLYGRPLPSYKDSTANRVSLLIPKGAPNQKIMTIIRQAQQQFHVDLSVYALLIVNALFELRAASVQKLADFCETDSERTILSVEQLLAMGVLKAQGSGSSRTFALSTAHSWEEGQEMEKERGAKLGGKTRSERILTFAKAKGEVSAQDVMEFLGVSRSTATRLLNSLLDEGALEKRFKGRSTRYFPLEP